MRRKRKWESRGEKKNKYKDGRDKENDKRIQNKNNSGKINHGTKAEAK